MPDRCQSLIQVRVDDRERRGPMAAALAESGAFDPEIRRLPVGDYLVDGHFLFERKTLPDLAASIKEGRLFSQALRLVESEHQPALVLEGTMGDLKGSGMRWEAIQGALVTIALLIGLPVLRSRNPQETVQTFLYAAHQRRTAAAGALVRRGRRPKGKAALQRHILQGLPGVGPARAARLIDRFGSVEAVFAADVDALAAIPGIGSQTAERMRWSVRETAADYRLSF
jgi:DNA excision repair protein ERCC-4